VDNSGYSRFLHHLAAIAGKADQSSGLTV